MKFTALLAGAAVALTAGLASAETRITYKSAKSTSSYYQMAVQIAEAMKEGSSGDIIVTVEESQPLLSYLFDHMQRHEFTCRFRWEKGGVILWDNRFTLHFPINDFSGQRRRMLRTTTLEA